MKNDYKNIMYRDFCTGKLVKDLFALFYLRLQTSERRFHRGDGEVLARYTTIKQHVKSGECAKSCSENRIRGGTTVVENEFSETLH